MISKKTKLILSVLQRLNINEKADYLNKDRRNYFYLPKFLPKECIIKEWMIEGSKMVTLESESQDIKREIIYYHGGAYAVGIKPYHFYLMWDLAKELQGRITIVDYPLAPQNNVNSSFEVAINAYNSVVSLSEKKEIILVGDSAGGGIALAIAMYVRDLQAQSRKPDKTILYSPWLDITLSHPKISEYESKDYVLNRQALINIGEIYAGTLSPHDYRVSPIYGNLDNLGDICVFVGTHEIFYPDCHDLCSRKDLNNTHIKEFVYPLMPHDWIVIPMEERALALEDTKWFVQDYNFDNIELK